MQTITFICVTGLNILLAVLRMRILRRSAASYVDPTLVFHVVWAIAILVYLLYSPFAYVFRLAWPAGGLLTAYIVCMSLGLWAGCLGHTGIVGGSRSTEQAGEGVREVLPVTSGVRLAIMFCLDVSAVALFLLVLADGFPMSGLFSDRSFFLTTASPGLTILTFVEALLLFLSFDQFGHTPSSRRDLIVFLFALIPTVFHIALTAGRMEMAVQAGLLGVCWYEARRKTRGMRKAFIIAFSLAATTIATFVVIGTSRRMGYLAVPAARDWGQILDYVNCSFDGFGQYLKAAGGPRALDGWGIGYVFPWVARQIARVPGLVKASPGTSDAWMASLRAIDNELATTTITAFGGIQLGFGTVLGLEFVTLWGYIVSRLHARASKAGRPAPIFVSYLDTLVVAFSPRMVMWGSWYVLVLCAVIAVSMLGLLLRHPMPRGHRVLAIPDRSTTPWEKQ